MLRQITSSLALLHRLLIICCLALGAYSLFQLIFLSYTKDWDFYITGTSAEVSAWITELRPPLWSYQICGGISFIADPNRIGVSPLIIFHLLFGPILGWKILIVVLFVTGFYFCFRSCELILSAGPNGVGVPRRSIALLLSFYAVAAECYTMCLHSGIIIELLVFLNFGLAYYSLDALRGPLSRTKWLCAVVLGWVLYSGAALYTLLFFQIPLALSIGAALAIEGGRSLYLGQRPHAAFDKAARVGLLNLCAVIPGLYKLLPVFLQNLDRPRGSKFDPQLLPTGLLDVFSFHLFPQMQDGRLAVTGLDVWQYGHWGVVAPAFSVLPWAILCLLAGLVVIRSRRGRLRHADRYNALELVPTILVCISVIFGMGYFSEYSPFYLINAHLFEHSARLPLRASIAAVFGYALIAAQLLSSSRALAVIFYRFLGLPLAAAAAWNLYGQIPRLPFYALGWEIVRFSDTLSPPYFDVAETSRMNALSTYPIQGWATPGFDRVRKGQAILPCYISMPYPRIPLSALINHTAELRNSAAEAGKGLQSQIVVPLIADDIGSPSPACRRNSYFTQQSLHLDPSCGKGVCLNLANINPSDPISERLCLNSAPAAFGRYCICRDAPT